MEKLLDHLNGREVKVNTVQGAKKAMYELLSSYSDVLQRAEHLVKEMYAYCKDNELCGEEASDLLQIAHLALVGYSEKFRFSYFHQYDGYTYLKANSWSDTIALVVLHQQGAKDLCKFVTKGLESEYINKPLPKYLEYYCNVLDSVLLRTAV